MKLPKNKENKTIKENKKNWYVYIVKCADNTLYTGITTDLERRICEHNEGKNGAKYTKIRRPVNLIYKEICTNRSEATKRELEIKKLDKNQKLEFLSGQK